MRVTNMAPDAQYAVQQSEQALQVALQQVSTGLRVNQLSDDPSASATMVRQLATSANVDQYTKNVSSVLAETQTADAALSAVVTSLSRAVALGTQGASGSLSNANRQAIATELQGVVSSVVSQANTSFLGTYVFAGSASTAAPFTLNSGNASGYQYNGNSTINTVKIGDSLAVQTNLPGDQVFTSGANVLGSLSGLVTALQSGTSAQIGIATAAISAALSYVSQQRVTYGNAEGQLNAQQSYLGQEKLTLTTQQTSLVGMDLAVAATNLSQAELTHSAILAAEAKVIPMTLLDYLK